MERFLIVVEHDHPAVDCERFVQVFLQTGSHFLTNADWGCMDGEHKAWLILEAESKEQARTCLPTFYHSQATIIKLNKFKLEEIDKKRGNGMGFGVQK